MAVNPNIALSFRPTVGLETPGNMMQQVMQVRGMEQQNQLRAMQMEAAQREQAQGNELADYMRSGVQDPQELLRFGPQGVAAYQAMLRGRAEERLGRAADVRLDTEQLARSRNLLSMVRDPQAYQAWRAETVQRLPSLANMIPAEYDPEAVQQMALTADQIIEKQRTQIVPGGGAAIRDGRVIYENPRQFPPPREAATRSAGGGGSRAAGPAGRPQLTVIADPDDPARSLRVDLREYRGGGMGSPGVVGLAPRSASEATAGARAQGATEQRQQGQAQLGEVIGTLRDAYGRLDAIGAMVRSDRNPAQNVVARARASAPGQLAEGFAGTEAQSIRDELGSLRLQLVLGIQRATGASARSLDSDRELQTWLNAVTNPTQSKEAVEKILNNFETVVAGVRQRHAPKDAPAGGAKPPASGAWEVVR
jgi:hypothetical protein